MLINDLWLNVRRKMPTVQPLSMVDVAGMVPRVSMGMRDMMHLRIRLSQLHRRCGDSLSSGSSSHSSSTRSSTPVWSQRTTCTRSTAYIRVDMIARSDIRYGRNAMMRVGVRMRARVRVRGGVRGGSGRRDRRRCAGASTRRRPIGASRFGTRTG